MTVAAHLLVGGQRKIFKMDLEFFKQIAKVLKDSLRNNPLAVNKDDLTRWLGSASESITQLENGLRQNNLSRPEKRKFQTCMAEFLSIRSRLQSLSEFRGGDLQEHTQDDLPQSPGPSLTVLLRTG